MPKFYKKVRYVAQPPGTLQKVEGGKKTIIRLIDYNDKVHQERELTSVEECFKYRDTTTISWINIDGRDVDIIDKVDKHFGVHPLVLEDIVNTQQRPKIEDYGDYLFFVVKMIYFDEKIHDIYAEQIGLVLGKNFVLSFQEKEGDIFDPIRQRLREAKGRVRFMGADYLAYCLMDSIVDNYFVVLEKIGEKIDALEKKVMDDTNRNVPFEIHQLKNQIIFLRKQIWPLREVLANFQRSESKLVNPQTVIFLRDVSDHTIQVNDTLEAFRDTLSGLYDIHLSSISNRMNEIMKVLTIFSAIFIPLTVVVGIYGMNFDYMPELHWRYGYHAVLGFMALTVSLMVFLFKKKKWL